MYKYVARRLLLAIPVLLLSSLIVFGLMRVMPGDALIALMGESGNVNAKELAKLRKDMGLDKPYYEQYGLWLWQMVSFNPGHSIFTNEPIADSLKKSIPVTLELATLAMILGLLIAIPIGVLSATRQDTPPDYAGRVVAVAKTTHLHMVFRVTAAGKATLLSAVEVPGDVQHHDEPTGPFIYEVAHGNKGVVAQAIPDPFEMRGFAPKAGPLKGHGHHLAWAFASGRRAGRNAALAVATADTVN